MFTTSAVLTDDQAAEEAHTRVTVADLDEMWQRITSAGFSTVDEYVDYMISLEEGEEGVDTGTVLELVDYPLPF